MYHKTLYLQFHKPSLQNRSLRVGFEPTREDPIGFRVQRLNHSAIAAVVLGTPGRLISNYKAMYNQQIPCLIGTLITKLFLLIMKCSMSRTR